MTERTERGIRHLTPEGRNGAYGTERSGKGRVFHGRFVSVPEPDTLQVMDSAYVSVDAAGRIRSIRPEKPDTEGGAETVELGDALVIPAFTDLHLHSAQLPMAGLGCDGTGEEWFRLYCHPTEQAYAEPENAERVNAALTDQLLRYGSLHAVMMTASDLPSALNLVSHLRRRGLEAFVGKMNSDFSEDGQAPETTEASLQGTETLIRALEGEDRIRCILSPEYIPACSEALLDALGRLAKRYGLPVQSHMNENPFDTAAVRKRFPEERTYARVWDRFGLFGQTPTVMAHCTYAEEESLALMARRGVFLAYCPDAIVHIPNDRYLNVRECMRKGIPVGLGSDVGGGHTLDMRRVIVNAQLVSKVSGRTDPLTLTEAFYLGTRGGGRFFGDTGCFAEGMYFDALVIDDRELRQFRPYTLPERLARFLYAGSAEMIRGRILRGVRTG